MELLTNLALIAIGVIIAVICAGLIAEALRVVPKHPEQLYWAPDIPINYVEVGGVRLRYIKSGRGPVLVLLHTLRTQLDIFEKLVPLLNKHFAVYAFDYPGHGFSDIPKADYKPELFVKAVEGFLAKLDLEDATLAGISIGGVIPLLLAADKNPRVKRVISINPYDYAEGAGLARANMIAALIFTLARIPVVGEAVMRLRNAALETHILKGGVVESEAVTPALAGLVYASGLRPGHYQAFLSLLRHAHLWDEAQERYGDIEVPVLVVYGEHDWSGAKERRRTVRSIPGARVEQVPGGGHFLSLDQPQRLSELIVRFAGPST
jgi:pimeloyl-ACP methyl ester carboxylesterase